MIAERLRYLNAASAESLIRTSGELGRMLNSLIHSIRTPESSTRPVHLCSRSSEPRIPKSRSEVPKSEVRGLKSEV